MPVTFRDVEAAIRKSCLISRGGFHPGADDAVPGDPGTLILVGNVGPDMWAAFARDQASYADRASPLDDWVRDRLTAIGVQLGATPLFPFGGPPFLPFQRWAQKAELVYSSPLGVLIHPDYGLWHAYRGALAFREVVDLPVPDTRPSPCESCIEKPCLTTCPVGAFGGDGYDVPMCVDHLESANGHDCMALGCRARRACPVGTDHVYEPAQAEFHMTAFRGAQRAG